MNKYPAPAPQQYSDYEDDDGPGLGTLGAALAAGALLTPVGRPVRALAKKGLGAADEVLGGYGKAGIGKLREGGAAARKAMLGENDIFSEIGQNYKAAELRNLQADRAGYKFYNPKEDFTTDATLHNLGMMAQGPKSVFETLFRNKNLNPQLNPNPLVDARAAADATLGAAGERLTKTAKARAAADAAINEAATKMKGAGFVPPTAADRVEQVKAESMADYVDALEKRLGYKEAKGLGVIYDTEAPKIEDLYKELKLPLRTKEEMAHQANIIHTKLNRGGKTTLEDVKAALIAMQQPNARGLSGSIKDIVSKRLTGG